MSPEVRPARFAMRCMVARLTPSSWIHAIVASIICARRIGSCPSFGIVGFPLRRVAMLAARLARMIRGRQGFFIDSLLNKRQNPDAAWTASNGKARIEGMTVSQRYDVLIVGAGFG